MTTYKLVKTILRRGFIFREDDICFIVRILKNMRVIRDICAPTNKVVEKISMTPLREIRENPRKVLIFR